jgi:hypothetical protein
MNKTIAVLGGNANPALTKEICEFLNKIKSFPNYSTWRDKNYLYISFWR